MNKLFLLLGKNIALLYWTALGSLSRFFLRVSQRSEKEIYKLSTVDKAVQCRNFLKHESGRYIEFTLDLNGPLTILQLLKHVYHFLWNDERFLNLGSSKAMILTAVFVSRKKFTS